MRRRGTKWNLACQLKTTQMWNVWREFSTLQRSGLKNQRIWKSAIQHVSLKTNDKLPWNTKPTTAWTLKPHDIVVHSQCLSLTHDIHSVKPHSNVQMPEANFSTFLSFVVLLLCFFFIFNDPIRFCLAHWLSCHLFCFATHLNDHSCHSCLFCSKLNWWVECIGRQMTWHHQVPQWSSSLPPIASRSSCSTPVVNWCAKEFGIGGCQCSKFHAQWFVLSTELWWSHCVEVAELLLPLAVLGFGWHTNAHDTHHVCSARLTPEHTKIRAQRAPWQPCHTKWVLCDTQKQQLQQRWHFELVPKGAMVRCVLKDTVLTLKVRLTSWG